MVSIIGFSILFNKSFVDNYNIYNLVEFDFIDSQLILLPFYIRNQ